LTKTRVSGADRKLEHQLAIAKRAEMTRRVYNTQVAAKVEITNVDARNYYDKNAHQIATELTWE